MKNGRLLKNVTMYVFLGQTANRKHLVIAQLRTDVVVYPKPPEGSQKLCTVNVAIDVANQIMVTLHYTLPSSSLKIPVSV